MNQLDVIMGMEESILELQKLQQGMINEIKETIADLLKINKYDFAIEVEKDKRIEPTLTLNLNIDRDRRMIKAEAKAIEELFDLKLVDMGETGFYDIRFVLRFRRKK